MDVWGVVVGFWSWLKPASPARARGCPPSRPAAAAAAKGGDAPARETDPHRLQQRQKQVDMGKNTLGYQRYLDAVPK